MKRLRVLLLALGCLVSSCAIDGGGRGSGVTTAQGNVSRVETAALRPPQPTSMFAWIRELLPIPRTAIARNEVEGIEVMVEGTEYRTVTDEDGYFAIEGPFDGPIALVFRRRDDGITARLLVKVPAGGVLTLNNVQIDNRTGAAEAESQTIAFTGVIVDLHCERESVEVVGDEQKSGDGHVFLVRIAAALHDEEGNPVDCTALASGDELDIEGFVEPDETIDASDATVHEKKDSKGQRGRGSATGEAPDGAEATPTTTPMVEPTPTPDEPAPPGRG